MKKKTIEVKEFTQELDIFIKNMLETMYNADGIGLAANQVGNGVSILIVDENSVEKNKRSPIIMINPIIKLFGGDDVEYQEGCLSIPQFFENVIRKDDISIEYYDEKMKLKKLETNGLLSRIIQHEFDHLNGILFTERITPLKRALSKGKLRKIESGQTTPHYDMILPNGELLKADKQSK